MAGPEVAVTETQNPIGDGAPAPPRCPFLIAASGEWQLVLPTREHRCTAFVPMTALSLDKQARLCLTADHVTCATYIASAAARAERTGSAIPPDRVGRWSIARTTPVIENVGGVRTRLAGALADRRTWPVVPVVLLIAVLATLGLSGLRDQRPTTALASATTQAGAGPTPEVTFAAPSVAPTVAPTPETTLEPTPEPSVGPSPGPSFRTTYRVVSGDTLSAIAAKFHTTVSAIVALNGIKDPASLKVGQLLLIP